MERSSTSDSLLWRCAEARITTGRHFLRHMLGRLRGHSGERPLLISDRGRERAASHALLTGFELSRGGRSTGGL
jgi:imidazoleglycerol phosphate dehydratase HisB